MNLDALKEQVGREHLVLDLSCRKRDDKYYITTDRWQKFTEEELTIELLHKLESWCDEYLIHGVDVEGKAQGIDQELVQLLARDLFGGDMEFSKVLEYCDATITNLN